MAILGAIFVADISLQHDYRLTGLLIAGPLLASFRLSRNMTAALSLLMIVVGLISGIANDYFLEIDHLVRILTLVVGGAAAIGIAELRGRDRRAYRRVRFFASAREARDAAESFEASLEKFAVAAVPVAADWCFVDLVQPDGSLNRFATAGEAPAWISGELKAVDGKLGRGSASERVSLLRRPEFHNLADETLLKDYFEDADLLAVGKPSAMLVPLRGPGGTIGSVTMVRYLPRFAWGPEEFAQAESLVRSTALAAESLSLIDRLRATESELRVSHDQIGTILDGVADGVTAQTKDGGLVYANVAAAKLLGFESPELMMATAFDEIAGSYEIFDEDGKLLGPEQLPGRVALLSGRSAEAMLRYRDKQTDEERWSLVKSSAVRNDRGEPTMSISIMEDFTDRMRSDEAQRFLGEATKLLTQSLDYEETLQTIARSAVPRWADWCAVDMLDPAGDLRPVAIWHADPDRIEMAREMQRLYPSDPQRAEGPVKVARTMQPELYEEITDEQLEVGAIDGRHLDMLRGIGIKSALIVPIVVGQHAIGVITLAISESGRRLTKSDLEVACELGRRAGTAVENARRFTESEGTLETIRASFTPPDPPAIKGVALAASYHPAAQVGGDFYDFFQLPDGSWSFVIGDVCGKGPAAATLTSLARYTVRTAAMQESEATRILRLLNSALAQQAGELEFCTAIMAKLKPANGALEMDICTAGHPLPLLRRQQEVTKVGVPGPLLGVIPEPDFPCHSVRLEKGDALFFYTDGLTAGYPAHDDEYAAELLRACKGSSAAEILADIEAAALSEAAASQRDDVAMLAVVPE